MEVPWERTALTRRRSWRGRLGRCAAGVVGRGVGERPRPGWAGTGGERAGGRVRGVAGRPLAGRWRRRRRSGGRAEQGACGRAGSHAVYIWSCRATDQGAALPRQDRWRGKPDHVSGQQFRSPPCQPAAVPPCMARHRHLAAPWQ